MLYQVNREIKTLNYKLSKVITTNDYHTLLLPDRQNEIECLEGALIVCKLECAGREIPIRFNLNMTKAQGDIKVYLSTRFKEP